MIAAINEGGNSAGLMQYLVGPGRANEHTRPHLVAGSDVIMRRWGSWEALSPAQGFEIARFVDQFMTETGTRSMGKRRVFNARTGKREVIEGPVANHVWHCSLSLSPREAAQGDEQWQRIARDFADRMGFTGADGKTPCRWVAVHHGPAKNGGDHIHIMVNVVREDGTKWNRYQDQPKAMRACNKIEHAYGLEVVEAREHARGARADSAADLRGAARRGRARTDRDELEHRVRAAAVAAHNEADFVWRLGELGVLSRPRFARGRTDVVAGYSVALRTRGGGRPRWYGGGRVARDLSLSRLRSRWEDTPETAAAAVRAWRQVQGGVRVEGDAARGVARRDWLARAEALRVWDRALRGVDPLDAAALADATRDVAGLLAWAGLQRGDGRERRVLLDAARAAGRHAQTHRRAAPPAGVPAAVGAAARALSIAAGRSQADSLLVVDEIAGLVRSLAALYEQAHQTETARALARDTAAAFELVRAGGAGAGGAGSEAAGLSREQARRIRRACALARGRPAPAPAPAGADPSSGGAGPGPVVRPRRTMGA